MKKKKKKTLLIKDTKLCDKAKNEMAPLLEQLYYGDIKPGLERSTPAYQKVIDRLSAQEEKIFTLLGKENKALFTDYLEEGQQDLLDVARIESFSQGYRLGARLMLAAFVEGDLSFPVKL